MPETVPTPFPVALPPLGKLRTPSATVGEPLLHTFPIVLQGSDSYMCLCWSDVSHLLTVSLFGVHAEVPLVLDSGLHPSLRQILDEILTYTYKLTRPRISLAFSKPSRNRGYLEVPLHHCLSFQDPCATSPAPPSVPASKAWHANKTPQVACSRPSSPNERRGKGEKEAHRLGRLHKG